jgi:uncharacterized protein (DUF736 family)
MARYPNSGALFKNDKKGNNKSPDYKGQAEINGVEMWVSAWIKESRDGDKFLSMAFEEKKARESGFAVTSRAASRDDSDIPF